MTCRICANDSANTAYRIPETMFGTHEEFDYFRCSQCGCAQIAEIPSDMSPYYPEGYYSFGEGPRRGPRNPLKRWKYRQRNRYAVFNRGAFGRRFYEREPDEYLRALAVPGIAPDWSVLDVGCGGGFALPGIQMAGIRSVTGADPFIRADISLSSGISVHKRDISQMEGQWDVILFHHSFEHMPDPLAVLKETAPRLSPRGWAVIAIPIVPSAALEKYGTVWSGWDAPRHLYLHSVESIQVLAEKASLVLERVVHDSTAFQFWASEQHRQGIPLISERSYAVNPAGSMFTPEQIAAFAREARRLNEQEQGDQAIFYLRAAGTSQPA